MSRTYNTNRARTARALQRAQTRAINALYVGTGPAPAPGEIEHITKDLKKVRAHGSSMRHGNHRKWKAATKIKQRRAERHTLNSTITEDLSDA